MRRLKKRRAARTNEPDWRDEMDLDIGWLADRSDEEMRVLWERHRDYMMALDRPAGTRPVAWWVFEKGIDPQTRDQPGLLFEMGEMDDAEIDAVRRGWVCMPVELRPAFMESRLEKIVT